MVQKSLIQTIMEIVSTNQEEQTREAQELIKRLPKTPEIRRLSERLKIADQKIKKQCSTVLKADRIARKLI